MNNRFLLWGMLVAMTVASSSAFAEETPAAAPSTNPTNRVITPRKDQTASQQRDDQAACYEWSCDLLDWDPYQAYDALVEEGFAVVLDRREIEQGLICLAMEGATAGTIAGEMVGSPQNGAAIGAAMGTLSGLIQTAYLIKPDDPHARRVITRFEKALKKWETKYSGCLSRKGYGVD